MAENAVLAGDLGARIIGGCCGTLPAHLKAMRAALEERPKGAQPSLELIAEKLGGFSSENDGTGEDAAPAARRRSRRRA
jgi:5-methyltetrahydrofolate--homocysteine methyltransferase